MREKTIEQKLVSAVRSMGGICPKLVCPSFDGMPDRLVLLPIGKIVFVEVKRYGEKPRPLQIYSRCARGVSENFIFSETPLAP